MTHTYIYASSPFLSLNEAKTQAQSGVRGELVGQLESDVNEADIIWNPRNVLDYVFKGKTLVYGDESYTFDENGDTVTVDGNALKLLASSSDTASMETSRVFTGMYYDMSNVSNPYMTLKVTLDNYESARYYLGNVNINRNGANGIAELTGEVPAMP